MHPRDWISFKDLRAQLRFEQVLAHYGVMINRKGDQHQGPCPLPGHQGSRSGQSFSANLDRGVFQCFSCGGKGNLLEFAAMMERADPTDGKALRAVAIKLRDQFAPKKTSEPAAPLAQKPAQTEAALVLTNPPLDFELKGLEHGHAHVTSLGITSETAARFGIGLCSRGYLKGRIAIPLHDAEGKLVGYAGRAVEKTPHDTLYRFPDKRARGGITIEFRRDLLLYNAHRLSSAVSDLIVTIDPEAVWRLAQNGWPHTVATMANDCSLEQGERIATLAEPGGRVWLVTDNANEGAQFAHSVFDHVANDRFIRWVRLPAGKRLLDCSPEEITAYITL